MTGRILCVSLLLLRERDSREQALPLPGCLSLSPSLSVGGGVGVCGCQYRRAAFCPVRLELRLQNSSTAWIATTPVHRRSASTQIELSGYPPPLKRLRSEQGPDISFHQVCLHVAHSRHSVNEMTAFGGNGFRRDSSSATGILSYLGSNACKKAKHQIPPQQRTEDVLSAPRERYLYSARLA